MKLISSSSDWTELCANWIVHLDTLRQERLEDMSSVNFAQRTSKNEVLVE